MNQPQVLNSFGRDLSTLSKKNLTFQVNLAFQYWRTTGFPFTTLNLDEVTKNYVRLECSRLLNDINKEQLSNSTVGLRLANSFHPQIWKVPSQGHRKSPLDHFKDDETLKKLLLRAIRFWPNRKCWTASCIRDLFRMYAGGRVSNFRPVVARQLIHEFSKTGDVILDFCSGYGGRLLGAISLDRHYIGLDVEMDQITGSSNMIQSLSGIAKGSAELHHGLAEEKLPLYDSNSIDMIITSPPYFNLEKYSAGLGQSYVRYDNYERWKTNFLEKVLHEAHRILKPNSFLVINIANIPKFPIAKDLELISKQLFQIDTLTTLPINSRPYQRKTGNAERGEPVFVFKKT